MNRLPSLVKSSLLALLLIAFYAQNTMASENWLRFYGGEHGEAPISVFPILDNRYILSGHTGSFGVSGPWILQLDSDGQILWQKSYSAARTESLSVAAVRPTRDGAFIAIGTSNYYNAEESAIRVWKMDSTGEVIWHREFDDNREASFGYSIRQTPDGGYLAIGEIWATGLWVLKLDPTGKVQWQKVFSADNCEYHRVAALRLTQQGGYLMGGVCGEFGASNGDYWMLKLTQQGTVVWSRKIGRSGHDELYGLQTTRDGGSILAGRIWGDGLTVAKLDTNGNLQWHNKYTAHPAQTESSIRQTSDGGFIVVGHKLAKTSDLWLMKLDTVGRIQWEKSYDYGKGDAAISVSPLSDGFIVAGYTLLSGRIDSAIHDTDILLMKVNHEGVSDSTCLVRRDTVSIAKPSYASIYATSVRTMSFPFRTRLISARAVSTTSQSETCE